MIVRKMKPRVFVIVLNWNGKNIIRQCLDSLEKQTQKHQVVVVDNGSKDGSVELIEKNYPDVELIKESKNHGFAGGVNIGIQYAIDQGADYIALLNNDAAAEASWLENLVKRITQDKLAGIVTCKFMRDDKKRIDSTGDFYTIWGIPGPRGRNQQDKGQYEKAEPVFAASGGASLYRSGMLKKIGLFDERFFAYIEDVDLSFRAQLAGWKVWYEPKAVAYHKVSATTSKMAKGFTRYQWGKNFHMVYTKNMPGRLYFKYLPLFLTQSFIYSGRSLQRGEYWPYIKGELKFLILLPGILRDRRRIQKSRKISTKQVDKLLVHSRPPKIPQP